MYDPITPLQAIPEAVLWEEGMLLSPQHFQQAARRQEEILHYHVHLSAPFQWGVVDLEWDRTLLARNLLRVTRLEAVMPDGLAVRHHPRDTLQVDLKAHLGDARIGPVAIWLTVPAQRGADHPWQGSLERTRPTEGAPTVDENTGEAVIVRRARPVLRLEAGARPSNAYVTLPVARLEIRDEALAITDFVPPLLCCTRESEPFQLCDALAQRTRQRASDLAQRGVASEEVHRSVRVMAGALPPFEAVLHTERPHPFTLYHALCAFVGWLAGAIPGKVPPAFTGYDHENPGAAFHEVIAYANSLLSGMAQTRRNERFDIHGGGFRLPILRAEWVHPEGLVVGLLAPEGKSEADIAAWMAECKIASEGRMEALQYQRVSGAARDAVTNPARFRMSPGKGEALFRVIADDDFVEVGKPLVIVNPNDPAGKRRPAAASLYTP